MRTSTKALPCFALLSVVLVLASFRRANLPDLAMKSADTIRTAPQGSESPEAAIRTVLKGLHENHPDAVWLALPSSYQRDVNELMHLVARRLHPEAWRWFLQISAKGARLARALSSAEQEAPPDIPSDNEAEPSKVWIRLAESLERLSRSGPEGLVALQTGDMGHWIRSEGRRLMPELRNNMEGFEEWIASIDPASARLTVTKSNGDTATIEYESSSSTAREIELVRVEGKWIPRQLSDEWGPALAGARDLVQRVLPSDNPRENFGLPFQLLSSADFFIDQAQAESGSGAEGEPGTWAAGSEAVSSVMQGLILLGYLMGGPPTADPDFHARTKQNLRGKNGKNVVLVYCYAPKELKWDNESVDYDIAKHVAYRLLQNKIKVVDPDPLYDWLEKHDDWRTTSDLGKRFGVEYVIHIDVKDYTLFERNSDLYRGQADIIVTVVQMNDDHSDGHAVYTVPVRSSFPSRAPIDSSQMGFTEFKKRYLSALSEEIGRLFYSAEVSAEDPAEDARLPAPGAGAFRVVHESENLPGTRPERERRPKITTRDVVEMSQASVSDDVICGAIRLHGVRFDASPKSVAALQHAGVSDAVIDAMRNASDEEGSDGDQVAPR
jgi:hypothetical protein